MGSTRHVSSQNEALALLLPWRLAAADITTRAPAVESRSMLASAGVTSHGPRPERTWTPTHQPSRQPALMRLQRRARAEGHLTALRAPGRVPRPAPPPRRQFIQCRGLQLVDHQLGLPRVIAVEDHDRTREYLGGCVIAARRHGYCAGKDRWVRTWTEAKRLQEARGRAGLGPSPGAVHPNVRGHAAYRDALLPALRRLGIPTG